MKIGQITLDGNFNYGNVLQKYAMQSVLNRFGETEYLWHSPENFMPFVWYKMGWKEHIKLVLNWRGFRKKIFSNAHGMEMIRQGKIHEWCARYIKTRKLVGDFAKSVDDYDFLISGSDQVWNPANDDLEILFLLFAPPEKRVAYAASISCPSIPVEKQSLYKQGLTGMAHISMREQQGADMVKAYSGCEVPVVVDPTLLLTPDDWRKVSRMPVWYHGEDYILTYFLGKKPEVVKRLKQEMGLKVINLLDESVYEHYVTGPDEFLWAIEHAKLVYTDSFHGTVFSILFRTPFVVCNRMGNKVTEKMGSRIDTLLDYFDLKERRGTKENGFFIENPMVEPDWSKVDGVLTRERERSDAYLRQALKI